MPGAAVQTDLEVACLTMHFARIALGGHLQAQAAGQSLQPAASEAEKALPTARN